MVGIKSLGWLPEPYRRRNGAAAKKESSNLGILAFEAAKTMSRLVSLYKSLSDEEICRLKNDVIKSEGISYLNSADEEFLLSLASAERLEDLDRAANVVSRLGKKCDDFGLNRFDIFYMDMKLGIIDLGKLEYGTRVAAKKVREMEKLVETTSCLHAALAGLTELEILETKMKLLKNKNFDIFVQKIEHQRNEVRNFREISLWSKSFDKIVDLMARIICVIYARICSVFGPQKKFSPKLTRPHSGPILTKSKPVLIRFYSRKTFDDEENVAKKDEVFHAAGPGTVGGSGLALRYANVILSAEKYLESTAAISYDERESLYQMLPENLKGVVRMKLGKNMKMVEDDESLAEGWRTAVEEMMRWLVPVARDTVKWQMERNFEKMKFDGEGWVLLLQTLHFADKEKTEAAIVEVLVGLSCVLRFEKRRLGA
ncbi:hypothetical protein CDL12_19833 [Handroanthus impetiginosus]|uniref:DUF668 domain-containing protein n=1 Tax=Handroanthus impetiginosus TaxID=429701 RepID=A0A2G9GQL4_9LAMI|nr:hypothetical protein CDL12_19833 [Handroanthus impetiginosus]